MKQLLLGCYLFLVAATAVSCADDSSGDILSPSPTGTYLDPKDGLGEAGYEVRDEVCENTDDPKYMNRYITPMFRDIAVVGDMAYLVDGSMLWTLSITDPSAPERLSLIRLPGTPKSLAAAENHLFVANGTSSLIVVDVSNPRAPTVAASLDDLPGISLDAAIVGDTLYIATGEGLVTADISTPTAPARLSNIELPGFTNAVTVSGGIAYTASCSRTSMIDVTDPTLPLLLNTVAIPEGHARDVAVEGGRLIVAGGEALFLVDARNPETASIASFYNDPGAHGFYVNAAVLKDGIAFIAAGDESFRAVDIIRMTAIAQYVSPVDATVNIDAPVQADPPGTIFIVNSDPIGIAVHQEKLLVLGNFRWVGERLLRILDIADLSRAPFDIGRYAQPRVLLGADTFDGNIFAHGADGQTRVSSINGNQVKVIELPSAVVKMTTRGETPHLLLENGDVYRAGNFDAYLKIAEDANDLAVSTQIAAVTDPLHNAVTVEQIGTAFTSASHSIEEDDAFLGFARLFAESNRVYAYDWALGYLHVLRRTPDETLESRSSLPIGECEGYDVADFYSGRDSDKVRMQKTKDGFALLCPYDSFGMSSILFFSLEDADAPALLDRWDLPPERYGDFSVQDDAVYTVGFDNNSYRSILHRFNATDDVSIEMDGGANGIAVLGDELFVSDQDFGLRHFRFEADTISEMDAPSADQRRQ